MVIAPGTDLEDATAPAHLLDRGAPERLGIDPAALQRFAAAVAAQPEAHSLMVVRDGVVVAEGWAHPYAPRLRHQMYSVSKTATALAVGLAVDEGLLGLDEPVVEVLSRVAPEAVPHVAGPGAGRVGRITVRHLVTMSSGHAADHRDLLAGPDPVRRYLEQPVPHEPGERFLYSTTSTFVPAFLVERAAGTDLLRYLGERVLDPMGIPWQGDDAVTWDRTPSGATIGGSGLNLRTEELAALGVLLAHDGVWRGRRLLPAGWVAQMRTAQVATVPDAPEGPGAPDVAPGADSSLGYGLGVWLGRHGSFRADGAFGQLAVVVPGAGLVVAVTGAFADVQRTLDAVWDELLPGVGAGLGAPEGASEGASQGAAGGTAESATGGGASERLELPALTPVAALTPVTATTPGVPPGVPDPAIVGRWWALDGPVARARLDLGDRVDTLTIVPRDPAPGEAAPGATGGREVRVAVGHGGPVATRLPVPATLLPGSYPPPPDDALVAGTWTTDGAWVMTARLVRSPFVVTVTARRTGNDPDVLDAEARANVAFGPTLARAAARAEPSAGAGPAVTVTA